MEGREPKTRYARAGQVSIAYQIVGGGTRDLVFVPGWVSNVEEYWTNASCRRFLERLASFSRLVVFDKRGTGLSDRVERVPHLEERIDDITAVLSAVRSPSTALLGFSEGGAIASLFAATYPERVSALVLYAANAKCTQTEDYPCGYTPEQAESMFTGYIEHQWGSGEGAGLHSPSVRDDPEVKEWLGRVERLGASPGAALALWKADTEMDVRAALPAIQAPTLILHRAGDPFVDVGHSRFLAQQIRHARYVELPGRDHLPWFGDADPILEEIEEFLTGAKPAVVTNRILATVMFTDIVQSTDLAARLGDRKWRELLERHHTLIREELARHQGREIATAGDGFLGAFHGPARAIACARAIVTGVRSLGLEVRIGVHTGECETIGADLAGLAVHLGARIAAVAGPGEVLVSRTVRDLVVGSGIVFVDRGAHQFKGIPDHWHIFEVASVHADR